MAKYQELLTNPTGSFGAGTSSLERVRSLPSPTTPGLPSTTPPTPHNSTRHPSTHRLSIRQPPTRCLLTQPNKRMSRPSASPPKPWERAGGSTPMAHTSLPSATPASLPTSTAAVSAGSPVLPERPATMGSAGGGASCFSLVLWESADRIDCSGSVWTAGGTTGGSSKWLFWLRGVGWRHSRLFEAGTREEMASI